MPRFDFFPTPRIVFGRGRVAEIGPVARSLGRRALLVYNGDEPGAGGPVDRVAALLREASVETTLFRQRGEPRVADVERAVAAAREAGCDVLVALGGGSAIDCGKAIAGVVANGGSPLDYMEVIGRGRPLTRAALPWVAVPTTAGTGAEVTRNAVVGEPARKFKASLRSELLLPRVALVDPELGKGVPPAVTAASGMDALCQLIESYTSSGAGPMTDALALKGIALVADALPRAYRDGGDLDAREAMALAALLSGITLTNAGLGAVHGFAAPRDRRQRRGPSRPLAGPPDAGAVRNDRAARRRLARSRRGSPRNGGSRPRPARPATRRIRGDRGGCCADGRAGEEGEQHAVQPGGFAG